MKLLKTKFVNFSVKTFSFNVISVHQPTFINWLGFFHKIYVSDLFVFHDSVKKDKFTNRALVLNSPNQGGKSYLTVPLKKHRDNTPISDLVIDNSQQWQRKMRNKIFEVYHHSIYYDEYLPMVESIIGYANNSDLLVDFNIHATKKISDLLGFNTKFELASSFDNITAHKSEYLVKLASYLNAKTYFSGLGAKKYQTVSEYMDKGVSLSYQHLWTFMENQHYYQPGVSSFINGLSIIDALFNIGGDNILKLFKEYEAIYPI